MYGSALYRCPESEHHRCVRSTEAELRVLARQVELKHMSAWQRDSAQRWDHRLLALWARVLAVLQRLRQAILWCALQPIARMPLPAEMKSRHEDRSLRLGL